MTRRPPYVRAMVLLGAACGVFGGAVAADSTAAKDTYLPPSAVVPYGTAPRAKEHLVSSADGTETYSLILYDGDEVLTALTEFAARHSVTAAHFTAIGAVHDAKVGWLDLKRKEYKVIYVDGQVEVLSLIGDIGVVGQAKPVVHTHVVLGHPDGTTQGGHLMHAVVSPTVEIFITTEKAVLDKAFDPASGMTMFR